MLLLINKKDLMGDHVNTGIFNVIAWATTIIMIVLTIGWMWTLRSTS
jgi:Mn2+/Fe2+ NRAMP family transporter